MLTADYLAANHCDHLYPAFAQHLLVDLVPGETGRYFGVAGGCLDAPSVICTGHTYWFPYNGAGWDMPGTIRREH